MKKNILYFMFIPALFGCKEKPIVQQTDSSGFNTLCGLAERFDWSKEMAKPSLRADFANSIETQIPNTPALQAIQALASLEESTPGERYQMLQDGAKESGALEFKCQILKTNF